MGFGRFPDRTILKIFYQSIKTKEHGFWHSLESLFARRAPLVHAIFMKIAEPRSIRIMQFGVYICMIFAGMGVLTEPPESFLLVIHLAMVYVLGSFLTLGSILGAIAVLPGVWWLERAGLISMATGLGMYVIVVLSLGATGIGVSVCIAFVLTFGQRWMEIQGAQLAPKDPREVHKLTAPIEG